MREHFIQHGKMWGRQGDRTPEYFDVTNLKYWPRGPIPRPLRQIIPLVAIDPRRNTKEVQRIFGVAILRAEDFSVEIAVNGTEFLGWSASANAHFIAARPFLYALRLSQRADDDGRQRRLLSKAQLFVCRQIAAKVSYEGQQGVPLVVDADLEGIAIGHQLYLVSHEDEYPAGDALFWRAVADQLADLLEASGAAADFAALLMCDTTRQRCRLLDRITGGQGEALLSRASSVLSVHGENETEPDFRPTPKPLPSYITPAANSTVATPGGDAPRAAEAEPAQITGPQNNPPKITFEPTDAPPKATGGRRSFVVTGSSSPRGPTVRVLLVDEAETLAIVEQFERDRGRFPMRVAHLRGYAGPRCDIFSLGTEEAVKEAGKTGMLNLNSVIRFIEVKGRSQRTGSVQLTENELAGAKEYGKRFYLYRVFCDPGNDDHREVAILEDPFASPAMSITRVATISLDDASGAEWFELTREVTSQPGSSGKPD